MISDFRFAILDLSGTQLKKSKIYNRQSKIKKYWFGLKDIYNRQSKI